MLASLGCTDGTCPTWEHLDLFSAETGDVLMLLNMLNGHTLLDSCSVCDLSFVNTPEMWVINFDWDNCLLNISPRAKV